MALCRGDRAKHFVSGRVEEEGRTLLVLPQRNDDEHVVPIGRFEQGQQVRAPVERCAARGVLPPGPLPSVTAHVHHLEMFDVDRVLPEGKQGCDADSNGVVSARLGLGKCPVEVLEGFARHGLRVPGEVRKGYGQAVVTVGSSADG